MIIHSHHLDVVEIPHHLNEEMKILKHKNKIHRNDQLVNKKTKGFFRLFTHVMFIQAYFSLCFFFRLMCVFDYIKKKGRKKERNETIYCVDRMKQIISDK
jgi:hypothetical protein